MTKVGTDGSGTDSAPGAVADRARPWAPDLDVGLEKSGSVNHADETWMDIALEEAAQAAAEGEVPIGAVAILKGQVLARDHNRNIQRRDPTAHAEVLVLREAGRIMGNHRLPGVELFVTVEPCPMCAGAMVWARIDRLVFGVRDEKSGAVFSRLEILRPGLLNHTLATAEGVRREACLLLLRRFFEERRPGGSRPDSEFCQGSLIGSS